jgi:hypothetical protein
MVIVWNDLATGNKDSESTGFIAKKNDKIVEGTVCTGMLLRDHTIILK